MTSRSGRTFKVDGRSRERLYGTWSMMKARCHNPKSMQYEDYGGRGITVCDEWRRSFNAFNEWAMANGWQEGLTIDRIDNNGGYYPSNCRWVTYQQQSLNKRKYTLSVDRCNQELRDAARGSNIKLKDLANWYGVSATYLSMLLKNELKPTEQEILLDGIKELANG